MKKDRIYSLVVIILLLAIFLPLTIMGYIYKNNNSNSNPNHDLFYEGSLWFYDENNNYLNKYDCRTNTCSLAKSFIDDNEYNINYYKDGNIEYIEPILNNYAIIEDGEYIHLYDIKNNKVMQTYLHIKTYNTNLNDNMYIFQNRDNLWGVLIIDEMLNVALPFEYNFIGLLNKLDTNNNLITNKFIVNKSDNWFLVDSSNKSLTSNFTEPIVDYTDNFIITYKDECKIYNYQNNRVFENQKIDKYIFENNYLALINDNILYLYNINDLNIIKTININNKDNISLKYYDNTLYISENNNVIDTIR